MFAWQFGLVDEECYEDPFNNYWELSSNEKLNPEISYCEDKCEWLYVVNEFGFIGGAYGKSNE